MSILDNEFQELGNLVNKKEESKTYIIEGIIFGLLIGTTLGAVIGIFTNILFLAVCPSMGLLIGTVIGCIIKNKVKK